MMERAQQIDDKNRNTRVEQFELTMVVHGTKEGDLSEGMAVVKEDGEVEFEDCTPISIKNLEFVLANAKKFIAWRKRLKE